MYYEEKVIEGCLCFRTEQDGKWTKVSESAVLSRMLKAEKSLASLGALCISASRAMLDNHITKHVQFVSGDDLSAQQWDGNKLVKVTIEWVDESEADQKNFEAA